MCHYGIQNEIREAGLEAVHGAASVLTELEERQGTVESDEVKRAVAVLWCAVYAAVRKTANEDNNANNWIHP